MIVWSSAASPFCDQPEAQRTAFPTFDGLRILKLLGVIPEDVPVTAKFDRETGGHTYEVDDRKLDGWKPSTVPTVLREKAHTFVSILDKLGQEPPPPNHGEHEGFSVSMFPDIVVREARRRFLRDDFLSPMARVMQVYMEGVLACSGADVVQRFPGSDDMMRSDAIVLWMMITGQSGVGKDSLVSNITSDVVGPLIAKYLDCYPRVSLPSLPTFGDDDVEGIDGSTDLTPEQKAQVDQASKLIEQMRRALYVDPYVIVTSAKSTEGLMSATAASPVLVVAASEGRDILTAFGVQGRADEPDSSMNERWDCQSSKAIRAASMSGKDDRYVTNSPINVFAAIQPSVAALLLCNVGGKSTGMVQRFLTSPFFGLIEGFDDVAPLPTGEWERVTGALFAGLLQHAFNSAVLVRTVDKNLRVQTWGRTQVFCDDAAAKRFKDAVKWTLNSEDEADIGATMGAKRPRKAITAAGVAVLLEGMRQYLTTNPMPSPSQLESVVSTNHLNNFSPIISGSPAFVAGESFGGMKGAEQRLPYVRWQVEERHFDQALALVEALEEFMLRQLPSLDETRRSDEVELQATGDVIKAQGQLHAVARGRGDKLDLDMILRAAYLASVPLFDADGWFHASRSAGPRACRRAVQVLGDRQLLDDGRYLESKTVGKKKLFRWMIQLDDSAIETTGVEVAA